MVNQRGSVIAIVLVMSVVLTLGGTALLFVVGASLSDSEDALKIDQCYYDAESGMMMGTGWLRGQGTWSVFGGTVVMSDHVLDNQCLVTVTIEDDISDPEAKTVVSEAKWGSIKVRMSVSAKRIPSGSGYENLTADGRPKLILKGWRRHAIAGV